MTMARSTSYREYITKEQVEGILRRAYNIPEWVPMKLYQMSGELSSVSFDWTQEECDRRNAAEKAKV